MVYSVMKGSGKFGKFLMDKAKDTWQRTDAIKPGGRVKEVCPFKALDFSL